MSLTLYSAPSSTATLSELVLAELAIPFERVTVDLKKGDTKKPEFLKLNPNAKVPVLVDDGVVLWESAAITMYLGEMHGVDMGLYPAKGTKRGEAMKWVTWANVSLGEAVTRYARNTMSWVPAEQHNAKAAEAAMVDLVRCLRVLEDAVSEKSFLLGAYTLVDTHVNALTDWLRYMKVDLSPYTHLGAWSARCRERPAYKKVMGTA